MSYNVILHFKKNIETVEDAVKFANGYMKNFDCNILISSLIFPIIQKLMEMKVDLSNWQKDYKIYPIIEDYLYRYNVFRFVYFKNLKAIGLIYNDCDKDKLEGFDKGICFQNSTDQDYNFECWNGFGQIVDTIVEKWKNATYEDYQEYERNIKNGYTYDLKEEEFDDYYRKTFCYKELAENVFKLDNIFSKTDDEDTLMICANIDFDRQFLQLKKAIDDNLTELQKEFPKLFAKS